SAHARHPCMTRVMLVGGVEQRCRFVAGRRRSRFRGRRAAAGEHEDAEPTFVHRCSMQHPAERCMIRYGLRCMSCIAWFMRCWTFCCRPGGICLSQLCIAIGFAFASVASMHFLSASGQASCMHDCLMTLIVVSNHRFICGLFT